MRADAKAESWQARNWLPAWMREVGSRRFPHSGPFSEGEGAGKRVLALHACIDPDCPPKPIRRRRVLASPSVRHHLSVMASRPNSAGDLFGAPSTVVPDAAGPLAERLRPRTLAEVVGQPHLVGPDGTLTRMLQRGTLASLILWGRQDDDRSPARRRGWAALPLLVCRVFWRCRPQARVRGGAAAA